MKTELKYDLRPHHPARSLLRDSSMTYLQHTLATTALLFLPTALFAAGDLILRVRVDPVDVEILIPQESRPVRGIVVHVFNYRLKEHDRWATLCRELKWAHINTVISRKENNRPQKIRRAINEALKQFAKQAKLPELVHVPRTGTGFSAGGMVVSVLETEPDRMLTNAISCSWVRDPEKMGEAAAIPELFIIGAVPDGFKMLPAIEKFYEPAIEQKLPWALGLQHKCRHDWANSGTLGVAWIQGIARIRYPEKVDASKPIPLRKVDFNTGWRGDRRTINSTFPTVAPAAEFEGDSKTTVWLPDQATAFVWRAWQVKDSPVDLTVRTVDGAQKLPAFNPKKSFGMTVSPQSELILSLDLKKPLAISRVEFFHGDTKIGEASTAPWEVQWKGPRVGCFPVWAQYTVKEANAVTNPALICFEPK